MSFWFKSLGFLLVVQVLTICLIFIVSWISQFALKRRLAKEFHILLEPLPFPPYDAKAEEMLLRLLEKFDDVEKRGGVAEKLIPYREQIERAISIRSREEVMMAYAIRMQLRRSLSG